MEKKTGFNNVWAAKKKLWPAVYQWFRDVLPVPAVLYDGRAAVGETAWFQLYSTEKRARAKPSIAPSQKARISQRQTFGGVTFTQL